MTAVILAGGASSRMGAEKAFLLIDGRPLIEHILQVLKKSFDHIILVTKKPELYSSYAVTVVSDALDAQGPLVGIYTGLLASKDEQVFVAACDMPFLNSDLIAFMMEQTADADVVVPRIGPFSEPMHAVYTRRLLPILEQQLKGPDHRVQTLFDHIRVRYITESEINVFDPGKRSFRNLNTPEDYKEALCSDSVCRNSSSS